jgi:hypothetical protein
VVEEVHEADGAVLLAADLAWAAINTVLVIKGLKISELHRMAFLEKSKDALTTVYSGGHNS